MLDVVNPEFPDLVGMVGGPMIPCRVVEITATMAPTARVEGADGMNATYEQTQRHVIRYELPPGAEVITDSLTYVTVGEDAKTTALRAEIERLAGERNEAVRERDLWEARTRKLLGEKSGRLAPSDGERAGPLVSAGRVEHAMNAVRRMVTAFGGRSLTPDEEERYPAIVETALRADELERRGRASAVLAGKPLDAAIRARLDGWLDDICGAWRAGCPVGGHAEAIKMRAALTAVLALHGADEVGFCRECSDEFPAAHPCPTVLAIAQALGVEAERA